MPPLAKRRLLIAVRLNHCPSWQWLWSMLCGATAAGALHAAAGVLNFCAALLS
jgi:hypothetical protein